MFRKGMFFVTLANGGSDAAVVAFAQFIRPSLWTVEYSCCWSYSYSYRVTAIARLQRCHLSCAHLRRWWKCILPGKAWMNIWSWRPPGLKADIEYCYNPCLQLWDDLYMFHDMPLAHETAHTNHGGRITVRTSVARGVDMKRLMYKSRRIWFANRIFGTCMYTVCIPRFDYVT
jgi:hypothetical protein